MRLWTRPVSLICSGPISKTTCPKKAHNAQKEFSKHIRQSFCDFCAFCGQRIFLRWLLVVLVACTADPRENSPRPELSETKFATAVPRFDKDRAFRYLLTQTNFGPRVPSTEAHTRCLSFLKSELQAYADSVWLQEYTVSDPRLGSMVLTNVVAAFRPGSPSRILLTAHWDSRPWADSDKDPRNQTKPVPGANDGASGVAVLLEVSRAIKTSPAPTGIDIVFFDGEDFGSHGKDDTWCTGSRYFAAHLPAGYAPHFGINLDMVGDKHLLLPREQRSDRYAPEVMKLIFSTAKELNIGQFSDTQGDDVYDDHIPLNEAGIRTADLIDFDYSDGNSNFWHTTGDTPDKCSAESLEAVGVVLLQLIYTKSSQF
ncbi:MAG: M28 family peptidase [Bacteroidota bacterium]